MKRIWSHFGYRFYACFDAADTASQRKVLTKFSIWMINTLNKHIGFISQMLFETIPNMLIQIVVLFTILLNESNEQKGYDYLNILLSISILIGTVSILVKIFLLMYMRYENLTNMKVYMELFVCYL